MKWGLIDDQMRCVGIVVSDTRPPASYRIPDDSLVELGYLWTGWQWEAPRWTAFQFLNRFTPTERSSIRTGAMSDPVLADFLMMSQAAQEVVSDDPVTGAGMDYLVSVGILTAARKAEILS